jgi:hypothetical protein
MGFVALGSIMMYLITCGDVVTHPGLTGVTREFVFTDKQKYMILYWLMGMFWYLELVTAIGLFCLAYSTIAWFFTRKEPDGSKEVEGMPMFTGLQYAFQYHLGSLAFGSFIIALCRLIQFILSYIAKQAHEEGNAALECLAKVLACVIECFKRTMEFLNKNAYIDIAIHSNSFCTAAWNAFTKIVTNAGKYGFLNGATEIIKWAGMFLITLVGVVVSWAMCKWDMYTDKTSDYFLTSPYAVIFISMFLSLLIGWTFMIIFDMVSDTLLYCFIDTTDKKKAEAYCPDSLLHLMQDEHSGGCC